MLTVVRFEKSEDGIDYAVDVPAVDAEGDLAKTVNDMIQAKVDLHMEKARQDWQDYQDAFFATGGTEEEWGGRTMDVSVDYEIKSQTDTRVSFVVTMAEGWVASFRRWRRRDITPSTRSWATSSPRTPPILPTIIRPVP